MDLKTVLEQFEAAHDALEAAKTAQKEAQSAYNKLRYEIVPDALKAAGILGDDGKGSCTTPSGRKVYMSTDTRAYVAQADAEMVHDRMRSLGFDELIRETIHNQTLTSWVRGRLENGEEIPEGISVYEQDRAALRKA